MAVLKDVISNKILNAQADLAVLEADLATVSVVLEGEVQVVIDLANKVAATAAKYL